jgi:hypothetical protein
MRQVGYLPGISAGCTDNKTLNEYAGEHQVLVFFHAIGPSRSSASRR